MHVNRCNILSKQTSSTRCKYSVVRLVLNKHSESRGLFIILYGFVQIIAVEMLKRKMVSIYVTDIVQCVNVPECITVNE